MILVSEAGSIRAVGSCEAITWPEVASSSSQERAAMVGGGMVWATAAEIASRLAAKATNSFFMCWELKKVGCRKNAANYRPSAASPSRRHSAITKFLM